MKKITMYQAFDGTFFETEDDCLKYEFKSKHKDLLEKVNFYDKDGKALNSYNIFNTDLDAVYFIEVEGTSLSNVLSHIDDYYADQIPYTGETEGLWFWDEEDDVWKMWENEWEKLVDIGEKFNKIIDKR